MHAPDPRNVATYDELYAAFTSIYKANRRLYARLNGSSAGARGRRSR